MEVKKVCVKKETWNIYLTWRNQTSSLDDCFDRAQKFWVWIRLYKQFITTKFLDIRWIIDPWNYGWIQQCLNWWVHECTWRLLNLKLKPQPYIFREANEGHRIIRWSSFALFGLLMLLFSLSHRYHGPRRPTWSNTTQTRFFVLPPFGPVCH